MTETIKTVPLADLSLSPLNPRQQVSDADIDALAGSILTVGLLQNLAGIAGEDGNVQVVAGGRRLRALQQIAETDGVDPATVQVPVMVTEDAMEAQAWASTENVARTALHPADEVRAYRDMAHAQSTPETIASAFGVTVRHVKGRLRLSDLPEPILDALARDEITLDVAAAYTVSDDAGLQTQVFETVQGSWMATNAREIRARLMREAGSAEDRLARFVGRTAYEAEGGAVREDLFGEEVWFLDTGLLARLAEAKLAEARDLIVIEGWSWVEAAFERPDWQALEQYARTYPGQAEASDEDAALYDDLAEKIEAGDVTEDEEAAFASLSERLDAEIWTEAQHQHAGAILWVSHDGSINVERGLIAKEDRKAAEAAGLCQPSRHGSTAREPKGPYSAALASDLARIRTGALQTVLLGKPELVLDLLTFALTHRICAGADPVGISTTPADADPTKPDQYELPDRLAAPAETMPLDSAAALDAFAAFRDQPKKARNAALTAAVARLISAGLAGEQANPLVEHLAEVAGLSVRKVWTPGREFLARLKKEALLAIHREIMDAPASTAKLGKRPKPEIVSVLHGIFNGGEHAVRLNAEQRARMEAWLPEGMAVAPTEADEPMAIAAE